MVINYIGRKVKAELMNSHYYKGICLEQTETKIKILDTQGKEVLLDFSYIIVLEVLD